MLRRWLRRVGYVLLIASGIWWAATVLVPYRQSMTWLNEHPGEAGTLASIFSGGYGPGPAPSDQLIKQALTKRLLDCVWNGAACPRPDASQPLPPYRPAPIWAALLCLLLSLVTPAAWGTSPERLAIEREQHAARLLSRALAAERRIADSQRRRK